MGVIPTKWQKYFKTHIKSGKNIFKLHIKSGKNIDYLFHL